jgi:hypothetical protein
VKQLGVFVVQTAISWLVLMILLFVGAGFGSSYYDGAMTIIGTTLLGIVTNVLVALIGLPLRLIPVTRRWLQRHGRIMLSVAALGVAAVIAGLALGHPATIHDEFGRPMAGWDALAPLYLTGWFLTAFAILHTWWPRAWTPGGAEDRELERKLARGRALREQEQP